MQYDMALFCPIWVILYKSACALTRLYSLLNLVNIYMDTYSLQI